MLTMDELRGRGLRTVRHKDDLAIIVIDFNKIQPKFYSLETIHLVKLSLRFLLLY